MHLFVSATLVDRHLPRMDGFVASAHKPTAHTLIRTFEAELHYVDLLGVGHIH
jgi:hypothetical protein